jgi:peptidoglycan/LPS O-acetylase OafA/YrhL
MTVVSNRLGHLPVLDGLRGIAILAVIAVHSYEPLLPGGSSGLDLFFVLSGFLITKLLIEETERTGTIDRKSFYIKRAFRLLPALYVTLLFVLIASWTLKSSEGPFIRKEVLLTVLFVGNLYPIFFGLDPRPMMGHNWSLAVEEQFYFVWPLILRKIKFSADRAIRIAFGFAGTGLALAIGSRLFLAPNYQHWLSIPTSQVEGFGLGGAIAVLLHFGILHKLRIPTWLVGIAGATLTFDLFFGDAYLYDWWQIRQTILRVVWVPVIIYCVIRPARWIEVGLSNPVLVFVGKISYSWYLVHNPVFALFQNDGATRMPVINFIAMECLALGLAIALHFLVEKPSLALRSKFLKATPRTVLPVNNLKVEGTHGH